MNTFYSRCDGIHGYFIQLIHIFFFTSVITIIAKLYLYILLTYYQKVLQQHPQKNKEYSLHTNIFHAIFLFKEAQLGWGVDGWAIFRFCQFRQGIISDWPWRSTANRMVLCLHTRGNSCEMGRGGKWDQKMLDDYMSLVYCVAHNHWWLSARLQ